jgi:transcription antitermination factor NusG
MQQSDTMGARLYGKHLGTKPDNDNQPKTKTNEIPLEHDERRGAPVIEKEAGKGWYCLITVPQGEYRCQDGLSEAGVPSYVPTETYWERRRKGRDLYLTELQRPLFRSYCFSLLSIPKLEFENGLPKQLVLGPDWTVVMERDASKRSPIGVAGVMMNNGVPSPMPMRDARHGRQGLADFADDEREGWFDERRRAALVAGRKNKPKPVVMKGEQVRLTAGPFASFLGVAENDNDKNGVKIAVSIFGRSTPVFVPISDLENMTRPDAKLKIALRRA